MTRDELVEAAAEALNIGEVIDAVEPLIRADEVERRFGWVSREDARAWFLADLRAKVEALPLVTVEGNHPYFGTVYVADVLALIDGHGHE